MLTYNTHRKPLVLPEYGRVIQSMVDHALTIADRDERTRCAYTIVNTMKSISRPDNNQSESERRYWDHLAIMSDFKLDIDWPFEVLAPDAIKTQPDHVAYDGRGINKFQYGRNLINMIDATAAMEPGEERDAMIVLVANQMKKASLAWDEDGYSDRRVFEDLARITDGQIVIRPEELMLCEYKDAPKPTKKKKKK
ncbi:MAG: DUF4290 domain-containing protein [Muribaculaceae bacterium]|nr:DUF4290 domain-containing protein [Muribaculaceae bacterium]